MLDSQLPNIGDDLILLLVDFPSIHIFVDMDPASLFHINHSRGIAPGRTRRREQAQINMSNTIPRLGLHGMPDLVQYAGRKSIVPMEYDHSNRIIETRNKLRNGCRLQFTVSSHLDHFATPSIFIASSPQTLNRPTDNLPPPDSFDSSLQL